MMKDPIRRALRTLLQVSFVGALLQLLLAFGVHLSPAQQAAIITAATPVVTFLQNWLEAKTAS